MRQTSRQWKGRTVNGLLPPDADLVDYIALCWFFGLWCLFTFMQDHWLKSNGIINQKLYTLRRYWMECMLLRENRMMDAVLVGHAMQSCTFFASTTILILAGLVGSFGAIDKTHDIVMSLSITDKVSRPFFEVKMLTLLGIFSFGFLKFTWALRQFNYSLALIGSAPPAPLPADSVRSMAVNIADTLSMAVRAFNGGMRAYYFALAALGWFINPYLFMAGTAGAVTVLAARQTVSNCAKFIEAQRLALEARRDSIPPEA